MLSARDLGWIAGIVEGEGCISHHYGSAEARRTGTEQGSMVITVAMTDRDVMERYAQLVGGTVRERGPRQPGRKQMYIVWLTGRSAAQWAFTLYTLLGTRRRAKIRECIARWKRQRGHSRDRVDCPRGHPLSGPNLLLLKRRNGKTARTCRQCEFVRQARDRARSRPRTLVRDRARYWKRKQATAREMGQGRLF